MKNYAQAILLFTGYPLEPIVALEIQKSYQPRGLHSLKNMMTPASTSLPTKVVSATKKRAHKKSNQAS